MAGMQQTDGTQNSELRLIYLTLQTIQRDINNLQADVRRTLDDHEERLRLLETGQTRLDARMNTFGILQAGYTTIASAIAGFLGVRP